LKEYDYINQSFFELSELKSIIAYFGLVEKGIYINTFYTHQDDLLLDPFLKKLLYSFSGSIYHVRFFEEKNRHLDNKIFISFEMKEIRIKEDKKEVQKEQAIDQNIDKSEPEVSIDRKLGELKLKRKELQSEIESIDNELSVIKKKSLTELQKTIINIKTTSKRVRKYIEENIMNLNAITFTGDGMGLFFLQER
jgi:hypothetical protein